MSLSDLPEGWTVWNEADSDVVLAFRPDVFDGADYPAPCLPTIYLTRGQRGRRPGPEQARPDADWYVTLYLEPSVSTDADTYADREAAVDAAVALATAFAAGEVPVRDLYQVPRPDYLDALDRVTGPTE
jgi:hypothetical protein